MSFSKWKIVNLESIIDIEMGQSPKSEYYNNVGEGLPFLQGNRTFGYKYPTFDTYCTENKKVAMKNDVLMSVRAPVGDLNIAQTEISLGRGVCAMRLKYSDNNEYLFYLLKHNIDSLISQESGTVFGSVNKKDILGLMVSATEDQEEQKAIAHILSTLDEKIEVNNKINRTLEEMAQAIFKHWFVDFEFPNEDGEPYKSSGGEMVESELGPIPKGWELIKLSELCEPVNGYSYKGEELMESNDAMITIKNFAVDGSFKIDGYKELLINERVKDKHYANLFDIIVAHTDLTQNADIIGNPVMVLDKAEYNRVIFSMDTVKVIPSIESSRYFIYQLLKHENFKAFALAHTSGTTVLHLSKKALPKYIFVKPKDCLINDYNSLVKPLYLKISGVYKEITILKSIRDSLLPKLMSGEIRVPIDNTEEQ